MAELSRDYGYINQRPLHEYNGPRRRDEEQPLWDRSVRLLDKNDISQNVVAIIVGNMHREKLKTRSLAGQTRSQSVQ